MIRPTTAPVRLAQRSADFSGTAATVPFRWVVSRRERFSGSLVSEFAYDLTGKGSSVLRGGWGRFYYHSGQFTSGLDTSAGSEGITLTPSSIGNQRLLASQLNTISFQAVPTTPAAVAVERRQAAVHRQLQLHDLAKDPVVWTIRSGLRRQSKSRSCRTPADTGAISTSCRWAHCFLRRIPGTATANNFRPYLGYGDLNQATNNLYSNYNAMQITWAHQASRATIQLGYTLGKSLGIVGGAARALQRSGLMAQPSIHLI